MCDTYAPLLREEISKIIKPQYIHFKQVIEIGNLLKPAFLLLSAIFIVLGRPEWCANKETMINFQCTRSLDPNNEVTYDRLDLPILSYNTKVNFCMLSILIVWLVNLTRIAYTKSSKY